jgi:hypothetical protein
MRGLLRMKYLKYELLWGMLPLMSLVALCAVLFDKAVEKYSRALVKAEKQVDYDEDALQN